MSQFKLGHIGKNEIAKAIKVLEENTEIKNIFVEVSHSDEVRGKVYCKFEDLLSDEDYVCSFSNKEEYIGYLEDDEEPNPEVLELLEAGTVHCDFDDRFSNDIEDIVKPLIEDGKDSSYYSREEAIENLQGKYFDEALVVFLLNEY